MIFASILTYIRMEVNAFIIYKSFLSKCLSPDSLLLERDSQVNEVRLPIADGMSPKFKNISKIIVLSFPRN